jgi:oligosaccharide translocation protein RFT1
MRQSVVKHVLTEADRIAVGIICPLEDQGGYAIAMNYGSFSPVSRSR